MNLDFRRNFRKGLIGMKDGFVKADDFNIFGVPSDTAAGDITLTSNMTDGDFIIIGNVRYDFVDTIDNTIPNQVKVGTTIDDTLTALKHALDGYTSDADISTSTTQNQNYTSSIDGDKITITAKKSGGDYNTDIATNKASGITINNITGGKNEIKAKVGNVFTYIKSNTGYSYNNAVGMGGSGRIAGILLSYNLVTTRFNFDVNITSSLEVENNTQGAIIYNGKVWVKVNNVIGDLATSTPEPCFKISTGDIYCWENGFSEDEYRKIPGRFIIVNTENDELAQLEINL